MNTLASEIRWCNDIGCFTIDRPIHSSCTHASAFCKETCFNLKLHKLYRAMTGKDVRNEIAWIANNVIGLAKSLARRQKQVSRTRFMSRGEAVSNQSDIDRIDNILTATPGSIWWLPTRSWKDPILFSNLRNMLAKHKNVRLHMSLDPSDNLAEWEKAAKLNISVMFYGNDDMKISPLGEKMFLCPKTHKHIKGACGSICNRGCFSKKRVIVHLKQHS